MIRAIVGVVAALVLTLSAPATAQADEVDASRYASAYGTAVCEVLDEYPSVAGVEGVLLGIADDGLTPYDAGFALALSVYTYCPEYGYLVNAFISKWA